MTAGPDDGPGVDLWGDGGHPDDGSRGSDEGAPCDEPGCGRRAAVRLHVPWDDDREVCPAHARVLARPDGVVPEPMEGAEAEWP